MHSTTFVSGPLSTNAYLLKSKSSAVLIDAPYQSFEAIRSYLAQIPLQAIWLTHSHWDHIAEVSKFLEYYPNLEVFVQKDDLENCLHPGSDGIACPIKIKGFVPKVMGDFLDFEGEQFRVIKTPGHSPGSVCIQYPPNFWMYTGDTLFKGTYGATHFKGSDPLEMKKSLGLLFHEDDQWKIFPGHGPSSVLRSEKSWLKNFSERLPQDL